MAEPLSSFYSTNLNSKVNSIDTLVRRIGLQLGCPLIQIELVMDQLREFVAMAVEYYTEYGGYDEQFLLFDSNLYRKGYGIKLDDLFNDTPELSSQHDENDPNTAAGYDRLLLSKRKVVDVVNVEIGENTGTNVLFTMQYAMMQQMMGMVFTTSLNKGFSLIEWYNANEFLELRNKLLALKTYYRFDPHTQRLMLTPEPSDNTGRFYALIRCYVEYRFEDCLKNKWVQKYALALTKIAVGSVRGKFNGTTLLGQGSINYNDILSQGLNERDKLEDQLLNGTGGWANMQPPAFIVQ